jgi:hypothetical protein
MRRWFACNAEHDAAPAVIAPLHLDLPASGGHERAIGFGLSQGA